MSKKQTPSEPLAVAVTESEAQQQAPKAAKTGPRLPILEFLSQLSDKAEENGIELGKIDLIIKCFARGYSAKEIVKEGGFNRSTVYRQTREFTNFKTAPVLKFHGYEMYEARIRRIMDKKSLSREEAEEYIAEKDGNSDNE